MRPQPDVRGRLPGQGSGLETYAIAAIRIPRPFRLVTLDDLPPTIRARTVIDPVTGCWRCCLGYLDPDGYAQFRGRMAHRVIWERLVGPIPPGHVLDHVASWGCRWRDCIWIRHLQPCSVATNNARSNSASAVNMRKTSCGRCGAEYDLINTRWEGNRRRCRNCETSRTRIVADLGRAA